MKKVLIFSIAYYPLVGGAEVAVKEITDRTTDIEFDMITLRFAKEHLPFEKVGNINVYRLGGGKLFFPLFAFLKAGQLHKKNNYSAIWSIMANRAGFAALLFKLHYPSTPFLLTLQEGDKKNYPLRRMGILLPFLYLFWKMIFRRADYIQAISNYLADFAKRKGAKCPVEVVPNGVDIEKFRITNSELRIKELKNNLKIKDSDKVLITTSRLVPKNGIGDVIEAMRYLPDNVKFLILGAGPLEFDLKFKIENLKLKNRIFILGHVDHDDLPLYLKIADIFIRPSLSEGLGNSFLEAMAVGLPVIGTPVGGIPDFLRDGETGLFCEVKNPASIAEKVKIYLDNDELREKIIASAKKMVGEKYNWELTVSRMKNVFNKIINDKIYEQQN